MPLKHEGRERMVSDQLFNSKGLLAFGSFLILKAIIICNRIFSLIFVLLTSMQFYCLRRSQTIHRCVALICICVWFIVKLYIHIPFIHLQELASFFQKVKTHVPCHCGTSYGY